MLTFCIKKKKASLLVTYLCSASSSAVAMSKTLTMPELKPQQKICSLGWKATEPGLSSDTKSYN